MEKSTRHLLAAVVVLVAAFVYMSDAPLMVDERNHFKQIRSFLEGEFTLLPDVMSTLPGFHYLVYGMARVTGAEEVLGLRCIAFLFSLLALTVFWKLSGEPLQFVFLPLLFPLFFLLYTDVLGLLFVLLGLLCVRKRQYDLAALASAAAILVRQNAIVWLVLFLFLAYAQERLPLLESLRKFWLFLAVAAGFSVFVVWNGGVAIGDVEAHPPFEIHLGNLYFLLFLFCILFLPSIVSRRGEVAAQLRKWPVLLALFVLFLLTFRNTHPYNVELTDYFIRNRLLAFFSQDLMHKILFFVPVALTFLYLCAARLKQTAFYALYPATVLYLAPSWLIEQRYYIPPVVLFLLFRERDDEKVERLMTVVWAAISLSLLYVIKSGKLFF